MNIRVLIVEDSRAIADAIRHMLDGDFETVHVGNGEAARDLLVADDLFAAVLCDVRMPRLGGVGLLDWVRTERPNLVRGLVFMTTTPELPEARAIALTHRLLVKPFTRTAILGALLAIGEHP